MLRDSSFGRGEFNGAKLVSCERFTETSSIWNLTRHQHPFVELLYFLEGGARIHGERDDLTISVFDLVVYPEDFFHLETVDLSHHQEVVCLGIKLPIPSGLDRIYRISDLDGKLRWLFVETHAQTLLDYSRKSALLEHLIRALLHYIKQSMDATQGIQDPISRVIRYLHENLSRKITVDELARLANFSSSYLERRFMKRTGNSPIKYLNAIRLDAARRLLARNDMDITQVASIVGYDDPRYFSRRFTARFGVPPSQYRYNMIKPVDP